jgi:hypothetical protein
MQRSELPTSWQEIFGTNRFQPIQGSITDTHVPPLGQEHISTRGRDDTSQFSPVGGGSILSLSIQGSTRNTNIDDSITMSHRGTESLGLGDSANVSVDMQDMFGLGIGDSANISADMQDTFGILGDQGEITNMQDTFGIQYTGISRQDNQHARHFWYTGRSR